MSIITSIVSNFSTIIMNNNPTNKLLKQKRQVAAVLLATLFTMLTSACQKDGVYKPDKKLSRIHIESSSWQRDVTWEWQGNMLKSITYNYSDVIGDVFQFEYQGQRVKTVICKDFSGYRPDKYYHFYYNGKHLSVIEGVQDTNNEDFPQRPESHYTFTHNDRDQITEIQIERYGEIKSENDPLTEILPFILPGFPLADAEKIHRAQNEISAPKSFEKRVIKLAYEGDNVKEYRVEDADRTDNYQFLYTDYSNPMYRFFSGNYTNLFWPFTFAYSRNLPSSADILINWAYFEIASYYHNEYRYQLDEDGYVIESQYIENNKDRSIVTCQYEYVR